MNRYIQGCAATPEDQAVVRQLMNRPGSISIMSSLNAMSCGDRVDAAIMAHDHESRLTGLNPVDRATLWLTWIHCEEVQR